MTITAEEEVWPPQVHLQNVTWDMYQKLLRSVGEQNLRLTYDQGELEIMSPLPEHEIEKKLLARLIESMGDELEIDVEGLGSTTFKRKSLKKGLEPDECYYIRSASAIRGKKRLDLKREPPPDLAVEVDLSYRTIDKRAIYAALAVPEIWSLDGGKLEFLHLRRGKYEPRETSLSFPFLRAVDVERFVHMLEDKSQSAIIKMWRSWIHKNLPLKGSR